MKGLTNAWYYSLFKQWLFSHKTHVCMIWFVNGTLDGINAFLHGFNKDQLGIPFIW